MSGFERYLYGPVDPARPRAVLRLLPAILAFDIWLLMIGHAGRYGVNGFNVAHFALLDRVLPVPTAGVYIALLVICGLIALGISFTGRPARAVLSVFCGLYTLSWAISMLDSYQHHYFMSLLLACLVLFPGAGPAPASSEGAASPGAAPTGPGRDCGYPLLTATVAIVYGYAALAKCDPAWIAGHTLRRISRAEAQFAPLARVAEHVGVSHDGFYAALATAVIPLELLLSVSYALAPLRDRTSSRWLSRFLTVAMALAFLLHAGAEVMSLQIGWFSYYMLLLALICLGPAGLVRSLLWPVRVLSAPIRRYMREVEEEVVGPRGHVLSLSVVGAAAGLLVYIGQHLHLPGAGWGTVLLAGTLGLLAVLNLLRGRVALTLGPALASGLAGLVMWLAIVQSQVRFDFYRYVGGDLYRRGDLAGALTAYRQGERFAPPGQSRQRKIERIQRQLKH